MTRTGGRALAVIVAGMIALLALGGHEASAQNQDVKNPIAGFFNAIFGGGGNGQASGRGQVRRDVRPSEPVPSRQPRQHRAQPRSHAGSSSRSSSSSASRASRSSSGSSASSEPAPAAKSEAAVQVVVFGDGFADGLASGLEEAFAENPDVAIVSKTGDSSSLVQAGPDAWPQEIRAYLADPTHEVDAAVVMIGQNDRKPISQGGETIPFGTEKWRDLYAQRVENMMQIFIAKGKPLYWVGLPPVEDHDIGVDYGFFNEIFRARAYRTGAEYVDIWKGFVDENDAYAQSGPDVKGEIRELRDDDGIGFTKAGKRKLAHFVARELRRDFVRDGEVMASLPEASERSHPYRPSEEMLRTGRGEIVNLNGTPQQTGGLLAGGLDEGPTPPEDSAYFRVIMEGETLPPEPGRSDDFSWPRRTAGG